MLAPIANANHGLIAYVSTIIKKGITMITILIINMIANLVATTNEGDIANEKVP